MPSDWRRTDVATRCGLERPNLMKQPISDDLREQKTGSGVPELSALPEGRQSTPVESLLGFLLFLLFFYLSLINSELQIIWSKYSVSSQIPLRTRQTTFR